MKAPSIKDIPTKLRSKRLNIRRIEDSDADALHYMLKSSGDRLRDFPSLYKSTRTAEDTLTFAADKHADWLKKRDFVFGIWTRQRSPKLIGFHGMLACWKTHKLEFYSFLSSEAEGHGYMNEAKSKIFPFCFDSLNMNKVVSRVGSKNERSLNVTRKLGFRRVGLVKQDFKNRHGRLIDIELFEMTKREYYNSLS